MSIRNAMSLHRLYKLLLAMLLLSFAVEHLHCQVPEHDAIESIKRLSSVELDSSLPRVQFSQWLRRLVGRSTKVEWELNDCGERTGVPGIDTVRDMPMCVGIYASITRHRKLSIMVIVGTDKTGISASPSIYDIALEIDGKPQMFRRLRDLEKFLRK